MHGHFRQSDGTVQAGVRRIARAQIDAVLATIRANELPPQKIVHEVRRGCKALRGLIRIVRPVFPRYAPENQAFREIAHLLAGTRDARVLGETLDDLAAGHPAGVDDTTLGHIRTHIARPGGEQARPVADVLDQAARLLDAARDRVTRWTLSADGWEALSGGVAKSYRQARRAMRALARDDSAALSHEWRKHVKYHAFHLRLLQEIAPHRLHRRAKSADRLAVLLGDRHDLDMLVDSWRTRPWRDTDLPTLAALTAAAQKRAGALEKKARKRGAALFEEKPRKLVADWGARWSGRMSVTDEAA